MDRVHKTLHARFSMSEGRVSKMSSSPCQMCSTEFDWSNDECPHCGWDKRAWIESARYGLQARHAE